MMEHILSGLVRAGTVRAVEGQMARAYYDDLGMVSGWLFVLRHCGALGLGDRVLVLHLPVEGGDGFVVGAI